MKQETYRKRLATKDTRWLKKKAIEKFNAYIRARDAGKGCISCGAIIDDAGHYYAAGRYQSLRFDEMNVNGQCRRCNHFEHGNLIEYRKGLIRRYGEDTVYQRLDIRAGMERQNGSYKLERFLLIEIIMKYTYNSPEFEYHEEEG